MVANARRIASFFMAILRSVEQRQEVGKGEATRTRAATIQKMILQAVRTWGTGTRRLACRHEWGERCCARRKTVR